MTGYTVHTGSSKKFTAGWDQIFSKSAKKSAARPKKAGAKSASKKKTASKKRSASRTPRTSR